ncbi:hypothetical protein BROUX41_000382 [Berkeleyomyces rouxiae]|uniref:uncharacterized protein n=1 Tax=Berkeleyomyces rouxiae TaxID=2035830 RepID=UPI003B7C0490
MPALKYNAEFAKTFGPLLTNRAKEVTTFDEVKNLAHRSTEAYCLSYGTLTSPTFPVTGGIATFPISIKSFDGAAINLYQTTLPQMQRATVPQPAVLYIHPGAHCSGSAQLSTLITARYARAAGTPFFTVDYRLAPKYPTPYGIEDALAAFIYMTEHSQQLNIDPHKITVMGDSSGGGLAAGLCLLARDRNLAFRPAKQFLCEPMLDDRTTMAADDPIAEFLVWTPSMNRLAWEGVLGADKAGKDGADVSIYVAPARAPDLSGLPPAYIDIGSLDLFVGEALAYAQRLFRAGVEVEVHVWPGLPHMHDFYGLTTTTRTMGTRVTALRKA